MKRLLLIDGNSIMNRAFYGLPLLTDDEGHYTNALYGFLKIMLKTIESEQADYCCIAFDHHSPTFRHQMYDDYKGDRKGMPDELKEQMPRIKEILDKMAVKHLEQAGIEADDILGSLSVRAEAEGYQVSILSGDRDLLQLVTNQVKVIIPTTKDKKAITKEYLPEQLFSEYEVTATEFIELKGLMGDSSDNIPGVPGIGIKTATKIIREFHSIEMAYQQQEKLPKRAKDKLVEHIELARLSKQLATIKTDCLLPIQLSDCHLDDYLNDQVYALFTAYKFYSILPKMKKKVMASAEEDYFVSLDKLTRLPAAKHRSLYYQLGQVDGHLRLAMMLYDGQTGYYYEDWLARAKPSIDRLIKMTDKLTVHHLKKFLHHFELDLPVDTATFFDSHLASYLVDANNDSYTIERLGYDYTHLSLSNEDSFFGKGKKRQSIFEVDSQSAKQYLLTAAKILFLSSADLSERLKNEGLWQLYNEIELPLVYVLKGMEITGVEVDASNLQIFAGELGQRLEAIEEIVYGYAGETFNINSPKQLGVILFEKLHLRVIKKTKTGYSTSAEVLEKLKEDHPIIEHLLTYRQLSKLKSTYADGLFEYIGQDGRIHTTYQQTVASTGRLSSTEPNLQNIPIRQELGRKIRQAFVAKPKHVLVDADYSQIELRLLAHLAGDVQFIDAFNKGQDIHRLTASQVFHVPFEEVTKEQRRRAKAVNFGIVYGISDYGLSRDLDIPVKEANDYINRYFEKYPSVKQFLDQTIVDAKKKGYAETMYRRRRAVPELQSKNYMQRSFGERIAMNAPIQGSAADIIKVAMIRVYQRLKETGMKADLILQVHDELLLEVAEVDAEKAKQLLVDEMEKVIELKVPLTVDVAVADNWYDAK